MAKVQIKSERITPFGGIFQVRELFSRFVGPVIDKVLISRGMSFAAQPSLCFRWYSVSSSKVVVPNYW